MNPMGLGPFTWDWGVQLIMSVASYMVHTEPVIARNGIGSSFQKHFLDNVDLTFAQTIHTYSLNIT